MSQSALNESEALPGAAPVRTCVGCGKRSPRSELLRFAVYHGVVSFDPEAQRPGRGAWIHPDLRCIDKARKRRALTRALRLEEVVSEELWTQCEQVVSSKASPTPELE
ncbi:YlxR family protein [Schaalia cardiffensis]|uniref:YlxR family protein n=1 Tax=Schaalia cardiffensis TaxID=181487 RepID=UPI001A9423CB|nr:YlxR family protein [Schaalia cardiffensis]